MPWRVLGLLSLLLSCAPPAVVPRAPQARQLIFRKGTRRFRVLARTVPNEIRHDLSLSEIAKLPGAAGNGLRTQGLSTIRHSLATHTRFKTVAGGDFVKAWFDDVILEVEISSVIIHIPIEYPEGSCEYEAVLEHERGHGRLARENAAELAGELEAEISLAGGLPTSLNPMESPDYEAVENILRSSIARIVDPIYERYEKQEVRGQAALDRPDPYDAVYRKCRGWK